MELVYLISFVQKGFQIQNRIHCHSFDIHHIGSEAIGTVVQGRQIFGQVFFVFVREADFVDLNIENLEISVRM